jgi:ribosomal-protein-alanine N-acetyltransferase
MADLDALQYILSDEEVVKFLPEDTMTIGEVKDILTWLVGCYSKNKPDKIIKFTVATELKDSGVLIGWCGLGPLEFAPDEIELYYGLAKKYWGKGLATEAGKVMLNYAFDTIGLNKVVAVVNPENRASVKVIEKLGMIYESEVKGLKSQFRFYEGDLLYSIRRNIISN